MKLYSIKITHGELDSDNAQLGVTYKALKETLIEVINGAKKVRNDLFGDKAKSFIDIVEIENDEFKQEYLDVMKEMTKKM
jgi:hypothetical protein